MKVRGGGERKLAATSFILPAVTKLDIVYLLEAAPLFGGVKVVLHQANLLAARGHRVTIVRPQRAP